LQDDIPDQHSGLIKNQMPPSVPMTAFLFPPSHDPTESKRKFLTLVVLEEIVAVVAKSDEDTIVTILSVPFGHAPENWQTLSDPPPPLNALGN
jgi:hypothetical protein